MLNCLKFHHIASTLYSQMISWAHGLLRAVNSLQL